MLESCSNADPTLRPPSFRLPHGACDAHAHILGPASLYPYSADRQYTPPDALLPSYENMLRVLGFDRAVLVQPSVYGTDNRRLLDAMKSTKAEMRGIVVLPETVADYELDAMHRIGVRGIRANLIRGDRSDLDRAARLAGRIARLGWHLQVLADVSTVADLEQYVRALPVDTVFDHMGHMPAAKGVDDPGFRTLIRLLEGGRCWVKLSGSYRITRQTQAPYTDVALIAKTLARSAPERLVWGSDWPHTAITIPMPDDTSLLEMLAEWVPDVAKRNDILVRNPARLYGFD
ncbi:MAG TPA: amidohydrolase family protein [Alphaproteobacteria bacterium]|nr:amidohydrolase family protein [Alphaproteobacteria bacterium]